MLARSANTGNALSAFRFVHLSGCTALAVKDRRFGRDTAQLGVEEDLPGLRAGRYTLSRMPS